MKNRRMFYPRLGNHRNYSKITISELESQLRIKQTPSFNDNEAVKRLEALLKDEENMRREMEKTARNMKMELREEQQNSSLREIELEKMKQKLSTAELTNVKLTKECELKVLTKVLKMPNISFRQKSRPICVINSKK